LAAPRGLALANHRDSVLFAAGSCDIFGQPVVAQHQDGSSFRRNWRATL
jgi:hypothetical protein